MVRIRKRTWTEGGDTVGIKTINTPTVRPIANNFANVADEIHAGPPYRTGGPLDVYKRTISRPLHTFAGVQQTAIPKVGYEGSFYASHYDPPGGPPLTDLAVWGARGWNRALPIRDVSGIAYFLGELKDAPRSIANIRDNLAVFAGNSYKGRDPRFWASTYLNHEFALAPTIRDLTSYLTLGERVDQALRRLIARNNRPIRRSFEMLSEDSTTVVATSVGSVPMAPVLDSRCYDGSVVVGGDQRKTSITTWRRQRRIWFSSRFRYFFSDAELANPYFRAYLRAQLAGVLPDLNAVYNLLPWSWLLDWFTNTGVVVSNLTLSHKYRQVADYAYVMCSEKDTYQKLTSCPVRYGTHVFLTAGVPYTFVNCSSTTYYVRKRRVAASPYGFGLTWEGFSPSQLSILAALGMSRA